MHGETKAPSLAPKIPIPPYAQHAFTITKHATKQSQSYHNLTIDFSQTSQRERVVDDEKALVELVRSYLEREKYEVLTAAADAQPLIARVLVTPNVRLLEGTRLYVAWSMRHITRVIRLIGHCMPLKITHARSTGNGPCPLKFGSPLSSKRIIEFAPGIHAQF